MGLRRSKIKIEWSPEFAYAIGLIATDGNLYKDGRHFDFTSKDEQLVLLFKKCLGLEVKISKKSSGSTKEKKYFRIQFGDVNFYKYLLAIGITPRKSKTIAALKIPEKFFFDFLRGAFDGDGTIYSYWDKRWKHSFMFYTAFVSASKLYIRWLRKNIKRFARISGHVTSGGRAIQLKYAKKESRILLKKMFYKRNLCCLARKFKKIQVILKVK